MGRPDHLALIEVPDPEESFHRNLLGDFRCEWSHINRLACLFDHFSVEIHDPQAQLALLGLDFIRNDVDRERSAFEVRRDEHRRVKSACIILQGLPTSVVVDACPRSNWPTIIELPENRAHCLRTFPPETLCSNLYSFGLQYLTGIEE